MEKLRPYFIVGEISGGGQERQVRWLLLQLTKERYNCGIVIWTYVHAHSDVINELKQAKVEILLLNSESVIKKLILIRKFLKSNCATSIQSFSFYLNFYTSIIGLISSVKAIGGIRNRLEVNYRTSGILRFILCSYLPRFKISNNKNYRKEFKFPLLDFLYRNTFIVVNQLAVSNRKNPIQSYQGILNSRSASRLVPQKDIFTLIDAVKIALDNGIKIRHQHAGEGPLLDELKAYVSKNDLEKVFIFKGELDDINSFLESGNVFLLSSKYEGYPNVIMEAMCLGLPIVSTRCGDTEFLVQEGINGFIVDVGDANGIARMLKKFSVNYILLKQYGEASRKIAKKKFSLDKLSSATIEAYKQM